MEMQAKFNGGTRFLESHALALELIDPRSHLPLCLVALVVHVAHEPAELAVLQRLGVVVLVAVSGGCPHNGSTRFFEAVVELPRRVAEVVRVPDLVAHAEDGHLLPLQVQAGEGVVEPVVPRGATALLICARVPCGRAHDEGVVHGDVTSVRDVQHREAGLRRDVLGHVLGVSRRRGVEKARRHLHFDGLSGARDRERRLLEEAF
mmetsp:Transcript_55373/g.111146  ORF Transcript_55373/g.111146 Transcript_55373/m.111146 type:complete len:205 (-) Transcript_55373:228-842(-)